MTGDQKKERNALDRLADALVDDILNASDEEVLAEAEEDGIDPAKLAGHLREVFERAATEVAKQSSLRPDEARPTSGDRVRAW